MHICSKMNKELKIEFNLPEGASVDLNNGLLKVKKGDVEISRKINPRLEHNIEGNKLTISSVKKSKREKKIFGTSTAHVNNMIKGLDEKFVYKLQIANVHFPMTADIDKKTNEVVIKNFLGEKVDRRIKILNGVDVKIDKQNITVESSDIEKAGQTAANLEKGTRVRNRDRRIFQDGIFITEKPRRIFFSG